MIVRSFEPGDTEQVIALWRECDLIRPWNDPVKDIARKSQVQPELFLVGIKDDVLVATAMGGYDGHRGSLYYLGVPPKHRGNGYGAALLAELEFRLVAMGCPKLNFMVRSGNVEAGRFYDGLGYVVEDSTCRGKRLIPDL